MIKFLHLLEASGAVVSEDAWNLEEECTELLVSQRPLDKLERLDQLMIIKIYAGNLLKISFALSVEAIVTIIVIDIVIVVVETVGFLGLLFVIANA